MNKKLLSCTGFALLVIAVVLTMATCGGPSEEQELLEEAGVVAARRNSAEAAAEGALDAWAKQNGVPYRDTRITELESDGTFAEVRVVVDLRESAASDWEEYEDVIECRNVGGEWQCDSSFSFHWTSSQEKKVEAAEEATTMALEKKEEESAVRSTVLNVLCTPQEEWCQGMKQEFEEQFGITVNYVRMSSGESLARIRAERDNPQFDIWWGGPIDSFVAAKAEGLLEAYDSPNFENLRDQEKFKDADNYWAGIYVGTLGFCTNKDWLAQNPGVEPPTSWDDLLKPEFTGQVLVAHPSTSGTSYTALATVLQLRGEDAGWEYLRKYAGQMLQFTKSGAAPAKFVGQGEAAVGIVFSHDIVHEIEDNGLPLELTFPEEGTGYEIGGMGIIKGAAHLDAAQLWFDWALTAEAQALGPKYHAYQAPTVSGVELSHPELMEVNLIDYDFQWAGEHKIEFVDKFSNEVQCADDLKE